VFENRVLRKTFESKKEEVTEGCKKLHNDKLYDLYSSANIIRMIKSKRMRWAGHVVRIGEKGKFWWGTWRKESVSKNEP
jgi:hypothetical protein